MSKGIQFGMKNKKGGGMFEKKVKPVDIKYSSDEPNIEQDAEVELTELQKQFREKAKQEAELKEKNTSSEFWSMIVFKTQEQRDQFYEMLGVTSEDNQYINGQKLIRALEMKIETFNEKTPGKFKVNRDILDLSIKP
jgi:hypothetical protein